MATQELFVRTAFPADARVLAEIIVAAFKEYRGRLVPDSGALGETEASLAAELRQGASAFLAERDGRIIGCVVAKPTDADVYFGRLSVMAEARGCGAGRLLVSAVENHAFRQGAVATRLNVRIALPENQRFFASLGYAETGREAHPGFDAPTFIAMRKVLRP